LTNPGINSKSPSHPLAIDRKSALYRPNRCMDVGKRRRADLLEGESTEPSGSAAPCQTPIATERAPNAEKHTKAALSERVGFSWKQDHDVLDRRTHRWQGARGE